MVAVAFSFALFGLLQAISIGAQSIPSRTWRRSERVAAAPAIPTATLVQDFKKNNVSARWAEGHPKQWGTESAKYEYPLPLAGYARGGSLTDDEKYLVLTNGTALKFILVDGNTLVSETPLSISGASATSVSARRGGGYNVAVSSPDGSVILRYSADGKPANSSRAVPGHLSSFSATHVSHDGRRVLTFESREHIAFVTDFDDASRNLTLVGHTDYVSSGAFSPDDQLISTSGWDGLGKIWNATTGALLRDLGPTYGQNWHTVFSPDGKYVVISSGEDKTYIYEVANLTAEPIIVAEKRWSREAQWSADSELLATGSQSAIHVYSMSERKVVQTWEPEDPYNSEIETLRWYGTAGSRRLAYRVVGGLEVYDFEKNLKYRWGAGDLDHWSGSGDSIYLLKSKPWIGGGDGDGAFRFWDFA